MVSLQAALVAMALSGSGQTVMLDFYADWCAPCRAMNPTVEALTAAGYPVQRVNLDQNRPLAAKYGVQSIPCFIMLVDGRVVDRVEGGTTYSRLERMCKAGASAAPPPSPSSRALSAPFEDREHPAAANQPASALATAAAPAVSDAALLAASVRIRVEDRDGHSCGSGTIIDTRDGEALVLTCGHLFRDSQGKGRISVDLFASGAPEQVAGRLVSYDLTRDVGLVAIRPAGPVATARLAPPGYHLVQGLPVASVGCNNGEPPTVCRSHVTRLNVQGSVVVAGQPIEGRSGGGLFSSEGYVVGVCYAADPSDKEGFFSAPSSIYTELDQDQLAFVYKSPSENPAARLAPADPASAVPGPPPPMSGPMPGPAELASWNTPTATPPEPSAGLAPHEQAALEEIRRRAKEGAEVVCIIRPRGNPEAKSEVIMLDHASPEFLKQLAAEGRLHDGQYPTSLEVPKSLPKPHRILLEWSAPNGVPVTKPTRS